MADSGWKKPDEVMKQMREKKRALQARFRHAGNATLNEPTSHEEDSNNDLTPNTTAPVKRKNPFKRSPAKRPKLLAVTQEPPSDLFGALQQPKSSVSIDDSVVKIPLPSPLSIFSAVTPVCPEKVEKQFVVDWSLKTRARFTSRAPHNFSSTLKTSEEASGITGFVRCTTTSPLDTSSNAQFHQCCLVWQHPWLPWLSLFPRDVKTSSKSTLSVGMDPSISNCLINDWCESFRSLFGLLRARQCPYFYVCTHQFNVLFRAAGIGGVEETHALLTPTTRGLRDILQREDISFSMPLKKMNTSGTDGSNLSSATDSVAKEETDDDEEEEEEDDEWINDIGLHSNLRSKLEAERLQDGGQGTSQGAYEDSLILIEGVETQGLFNWLLNSKLCLSNTGPLAGIPPTLLSPVAFHHAALRPLKVRQGLLKQDGENVYSVEVQGPILPHCVISLTKLLQPNDFNALLNPLSSSKPFAHFQTNFSGTSVSCAFGRESLSDCGLDPSTLDLFCSPKTQLSDEIRFQDGAFLSLS